MRSLEGGCAGPRQCLYGNVCSLSSESTRHSVNVDYDRLGGETGLREKEMHEM